MFIKVVSDVPRATGQCKKEALYQCDRMFIQPQEDNNRSVIVEMESDSGHSMSIEVVKGMMEMYVMNDRGITVDTYRWPQEPIREGGS